MNSCERLLNTLKRKPTDRPPWMEIDFHPSKVAAISGKPIQTKSWGAGAAGDLTQYEKEIDIWIEVAQEVGLDALAVTLWGKAWSGDGGHGMEGGTIKTLADVERIIEINPNFIANGFESCARALKTKCRAAGLGCFFLTHFGVQSAISSIGFADICFLAMEQPEVILRYFDYCEQGFTPIFDLFHDIGPDFIVVGDDIAFGQGPFLSPDKMRELIFPHYRRMAEKISLPWVYHSDGNLMPIMDDLLDLGMNAIHPIEPYGTMDIIKVKKKYGDRVVLAGNLDMNLIAHGTRAQISDAVRQLFRDVGFDGGWILSSSNSIDNSANPENLRAMGTALQQCTH